MTLKRMGPIPDQQAGEKLFKALRELEIQFLNGGHSVQTSIQALLKDHKYSPANEMSKYLIAQSILKKDPDNGSHKKPYYFYNGSRLSVQYCNELILQMKIERAADQKGDPKEDDKTYSKIKYSIETDLKKKMLEEAMQIRDDARRDIDLYAAKLQEAQMKTDEYSIVIKYLLPKKPF